MEHAKLLKEMHEKNFISQAKFDEEMQILLAQMRGPLAKDAKKKHARNEGIERSREEKQAAPSPQRTKNKDGSDDGDGDGDNDDDDDDDDSLTAAAEKEGVDGGSGGENEGVNGGGATATVATGDNDDDDDDNDDDDDDNDDDDGSDDDDDGDDAVECESIFTGKVKPFKGTSADTAKFISTFGLARAAPAQSTKARKVKTLTGCGNKKGRGSSKHKHGGRKGDSTTTATHSEIRATSVCSDTAGPGARQCWSQLLPHSTGHWLNNLNLTLN